MRDPARDHEIWKGIAGELYDALKALADDPSNHRAGVIRSLERYEAIVDLYAMADEADAELADPAPHTPVAEERCTCGPSADEVLDRVTGLPPIHDEGCPAKEQDEGRR